MPNAIEAFYLVVEEMCAILFRRDMWYGSRCGLLNAQSCQHMHIDMNFIFFNIPKYVAHLQVQMKRKYKQNDKNISKAQHLSGRKWWAFIDVNTKNETIDKPKLCVLDDFSLLIRMEYKPHALWVYEWCLSKDHRRYVMILWYVFYKSSILNGFSRLSKATQA